MIKITALNETITDEDVEKYENNLTKEAQEQSAFNEYNKALKLLVDNKKDEALGVLQDVIKSKVLNDLEKLNAQVDQPRSMLTLKYSCLKNIAIIQADMKNYNDALYHFLEAIDIDDTDVMIWYKFGHLAIKMLNLDIACLAFKQALDRNVNHWPSLDNIISILYAIPDYKNCLLYISIALNRDPTYIKGLAFRDEIIKKFPSLNDCYKNIGDISDSFELSNNKSIADALIEEANELNKKWIKVSKIRIDKKKLPDIFLRKPLIKYTWLELGNSLFDTHKYIRDNKLSFISHINLSLSQNLSETSSTYQTEIIRNQNTYSFVSNKDIKHINSFDKSAAKEDAIEMESIEKSINLKNEQTYIKLLDNNISTVSQNNKYCITNKNIDEINDNLNLKKSVELTKINNNTYSENSMTSGTIDEKENSQKIKKRRRSSLCFLTQWAWSSNNTKRSSRGRTRKDFERDGLILQETIKQFIPSTLLLDSKLTKEELRKNMNDSTVGTMDTYNLIDNKENTSANEVTNSTNEYFGTDLEVLDVKNFISNHIGRNNILIIIRKFIQFLSTKWNSKWPEYLSDLYIELYLCIREHSTHLSPFDLNSNEEIMKIDAEISLLFCELYTDRWICNRDSNFTFSSSCNSRIGILFDDLGYIIFCSARNDLYSQENFNYLIRMLWMKANLFFHYGDMDLSLKTLKHLLHLLQQHHADKFKLIITLLNCKNNSIVSYDSAQKMITSIERGRQLCEINDLYAEKNYIELSQILKDTFNFSKEINQFLIYNKVHVDRIEHLQLLLDSLWQLQHYEDCFIWAEACLNEAWKNYLSIISTSTEDTERDKWLHLILFILEKLEACISEESTFVAKHLQEKYRSRLVENLVEVVCHQLDVLDSSQIMPIESVQPWILLHSILLFEEDRQRAKCLTTLQYNSSMIVNGESDDDDGDIPASLMILLKAHEFLGRHGKCCISDGKLLIFMMNLIIPKLHFPLYLLIKQKLKKHVEQIIYCLYGHPSKISTGIRSKPKYLDEHVKNHFSLTWDACQLLFEFYKPDNFPTFESKRVDSINVDTVLLFKKICAMVPCMNDTTQIIEEMNNYLLGHKNEPPIRNTAWCSQVSSIYYLIADHYFKAASNQSWTSAIKYYTLDLCLHPNELNSWAGLAMATSTLMETWLNNFQPNINEEKYLAKAKIAERSYQHAIDIAPSHLTIWTEYGNFLYTVHSFCSRLLKQESDSLNMERFRIFETRKEDMLQKSKKCFTSANNIYNACQGVGEPQDERWLYQYMLAKIAEKQNENPPTFLKHYLKASDLLYKNNAQYPKRISHKNPQNLAVEALEVYYRIHASILKYLEQHESKPLKRSLGTIFQQCLKICLQGPFKTGYSSAMEALIEDNKTSSRKLSTSSCIPNSKQIGLHHTTFIRKRSNEPIIMNETKKLKLSSGSHLQLMQDVVALTDELISKVCKTEASEVQGYKTKYSINSSIKTQSSIESLITNSPSKLDIEINEKYNFGYIAKDYKQSHDTSVQDDGTPELSVHKYEERKKNDKSKGPYIRRDSQESSTTQTSTTETNSSSSSADSSSSDDSSDSSSSSDSDSDSPESDTEKKKKAYAFEESFLLDGEIKHLFQSCIAGLEHCVLRFPEHYKSIYRLAHFYFYNKSERNISRSKQLLLGTYKCQYHPNKIIHGLFMDRKNANFFNGIWRIPIHEIDRPGSFASHMSRCVLLLMQVLKETGDNRMLMELSIQLRKTPDTDKKYLRDNERQQLSYQALTLCLQSLRNKIKYTDQLKSSVSVRNECSDEKSLILLDVYHTYQNLKNVQEYESVELPKLRKLLEDAYISYINNTNLQGNIFELAKECCRQKVRFNKFGIANADPIISPRTEGISSFVPLAVPVDTISYSNVTSTSQNCKSEKLLVSDTTRGRSSGTNKVSATVNSNSVLTNDFCRLQNSATQNTHKHSLCDQQNNLNNPYCFNPFFESNMIAAMLGSNLNMNMVDSTVKYLNQVETYQDVIRQYENNLKPFSNSNMNRKILINNSNVPVKHNVASTCSNTNTSKEIPDLSITPVIAHSSSKTKLAATNIINEDHINIPQHFSNSRNIAPTPQLSVLKYTQQQGTQKCVSQQLPDYNLSTMSVPQSIEDVVNMKCLANPSKTSPCTSLIGNSLQHKLLFQKQNKFLTHSAYTMNPVKKVKQNKKVLATKSFLNAIPTCSSSESTNIAQEVHQLSLKVIKQPFNINKSVKSKVTASQISTSSTQNKDTVNTLSMISQLQQHSHLEIIPHTSDGIRKIDIPNVSKKSSQTHNVIDIQPSNMTNSAHLSKRKLNLSYSPSQHAKKKNQSDTGDVEIITLDD